MMAAKNFNRKNVLLIYLLVGFIILSVSVFLLIYAISFGYWDRVGLALLLSAMGLMALIGAANKENDIIIDYAKKEVLSNIKFDEKETICVPFDSIVNVYVYNADQLRRELKLKKYPPKALVIMQSDSKVYIPLKGFDEETIHQLLGELRKVRGSL